MGSPPSLTLWTVNCFDSKAGYRRIRRDNPGRLCFLRGPVSGGPPRRPTDWNVRTTPNRPIRQDECQHIPPQDFAFTNLQKRRISGLNSEHAIGGPAMSASEFRCTISEIKGRPCESLPSSPEMGSAPSIRLAPPGAAGSENPEDILVISISKTQQEAGRLVPNSTPLQPSSGGWRSGWPGDLKGDG